MQLSDKIYIVELAKEHTEINPKLTVGATGRTIPNKNFTENGLLDNYVAVMFENGVNTDVPWKSIRIVDIAGL